MPSRMPACGALPSSQCRQAAQVGATHRMLSSKDRVACSHAAAVQHPVLAQLQLTTRPVFGRAAGRARTAHPAGSAPPGIIKWEAECSYRQAGLGTPTRRLAPFAEAPRTHLRLACSMELCTRDQNHNHPASHLAGCVGVERVPPLDAPLCSAAWGGGRYAQSIQVHLRGAGGRSCCWLLGGGGAAQVSCSLSQ